MSTILNSSKFIEPHYLSCLRTYWNGQNEKAKGQIAKSLSSTKDAHNDIPLYRLWIELAAQENDDTTLRMLKEHLNQLARESTEYSELYYSLSALVHWELDEVEGAELMLSALKRSKQNLYTRELKFWLNSRNPKKQPDYRWIFKFKGVDYIVTEKLANYYSVNGNFKSALEISQLVSKSYAHSPLEEQIQLRLIIHLEQWKDAFKKAKSLHNIYSKNPSYLFSMALAVYKNNGTLEAIDFLEQAVELSHWHDPSILNFLGQCYVDRFAQTSKDVFYKKALAVLDHSIQISQEMIHSSEVPSNQKSRLINMKGNDVPLSGRFWLAKVSAQSFAQLRTGSEQEIQYIRRPLGGKAASGDLCFIVCEDRVKQNAEKVWRLGALYKVMAEPEWDPVHRYQNLLSLEFKPDIAVSFDVNEEQAKPGALHDADDPRRFGVFQLDDSGFDTIINSVCESLGEDDRVLQVLSSFKSA